MINKHAPRTETKHEKTLRSLVDYTMLRDEIALCEWFGGDKPASNYHDRWQAAKKKFAALQFPDREEVEKVCFDDLTYLADESAELLVRLKAALQAELERLQALRAAEVALDPAYRMVVDPPAAAKAVREARAAFDAALRERETLQAAKSRIYDYVYASYGCELRQPESFAAAAQRRVSTVLGSYYDHLHDQAILKRLDLKNPLALFAR